MVDQLTAFNLFKVDMRVKVLRFIDDKKDLYDFSKAAARADSLLSVPALAVMVTRRMVWLVKASMAKHCSALRGRMPYTSCRS